jgi:SpoVK/Ycf46/Vps4 family AAA+-type ATPase
MEERAKELIDRGKEILLKPYTWGVAQDRIYFEEKYPDCILVEPKKEEVFSKIREGIPFSVLATFPPYGEVKDFFVEVDFPSLYGVVSSQEVEEESEELILKCVERKLGLRIHKPRLSLKDMMGAFNLKREIRAIQKTMDDPLLRVKGVLLVGIPGTGKSYSAKCVAGELDRWLIELNLSAVLEDDRPVKKIHSIFSFLEKVPYPFMLWIDEIDKIFASEDDKTKKLLGQMLTILEEWNTPTGYKGDGFFWATANDVRVMVYKHPEFFRRFDYRFFVNTPFEKEAVELFSFYLSRYGVNPFKEDAGEEEYRSLVGKIQRKIFRKFLETEGDVIRSEAGQRFVYTPAEISILSKKLSTLARFEGRNYFTEEELVFVCEKNQPIVMSMKDAIDAMKEQKKFFTEV